MSHDTGGIIRVTQWRSPGHLRTSSLIHRPALCCRFHCCWSHCLMNPRLLRSNWIGSRRQHPLHRGDGRLVRQVLHTTCSQPRSTLLNPRTHAVSHDTGGIIRVTQWRSPGHLRTSSLIHRPALCCRFHCCWSHCLMNPRLLRSNWIGSRRQHRGLEKRCSSHVCLRQSTATMMRLRS